MCPCILRLARQGGGWGGWLCSVQQPQEILSLVFSISICHPIATSCFETRDFAAVTRLPRLQNKKQHNCLRYERWKAKHLRGECVEYIK